MNGFPFKQLWSQGNLLSKVVLTLSKPREKTTPTTLWMRLRENPSPRAILPRGSQAERQDLR